MHVVGTLGNPPWRPREEHEMSKRVIAGLIITALSGPALAEEYRDEAPSGRELSEVFVSRDGTSVEMPGRDTPAAVEHDGNVTSIDFDRDDTVGTADADDTTIVYDD